MKKKKTVFFALGNRDVEETIDVVYTHHLGFNLIH